MTVPAVTVNQYNDVASDTTKTYFPILAANGGVFTGYLVKSLSGNGDTADYLVVDILGGTHDTGAGSLGNTGKLTLNIQSNRSDTLWIGYDVVSYATLNSSGVPILGGVNSIVGNGSIDILSTSWSGTSGDNALVIRLASYPSDYQGTYSVTLSNATSTSTGTTSPGTGAGTASGIDLTTQLYSVNTNLGLNTPTSINATAGGTVIFDVEFFNSGNVASSAGDIGYYLSSDATIDKNDTQILYGNLFDAVPAHGSTGMMGIPVTLPSSLKTGDYYLGVIVDSNNSVAETNENNNASVGRLIHVTGSSGSTSSGSTPTTSVDGGSGAMLSYNNHRYEYVSFNGVAHSWTDAKAMAAAMGGHLATITSQSENDFITSKVIAGHLQPQYNAAFIGASDAGHEGTWQWVAGPEENSVLNYTHWSPGEPNNSANNPEGSENYAVIGADGGWVDVPSVRDANFTTGFVVEFENTTDFGSRGSSWPVSGIGDFNADGTSDILWRNPGTGQVDQWQMQGGHWSKSIDLGATKGAQWQLAGVGDFNADGTSDVLWRDINNSAVDQWQMKNGNWSRSIDLGATKGADWTLAGVGDFNGDGTSDVLWRNVSSSKVDQWQMKNGNWSSSIDLGATKGADWQLAGVGDFNGDGTTDVLWRNLTTSQVDEWQMKNGNWSKSIDLGATKGPDWTIGGIGDANGDHVSDIFWYNTKTGQAEHWLMANGNWSASVDDGVQSTSLKPVGVGDFNHDGKSDELFLNSDTAHLFGLLA